MNKRKLRRILRESIRTVLKEGFSLDGLYLYGPGVNGDDSISFQGSDAVLFECEDGATCYVWMDQYYNPGKWCVQCDEHNVAETYDILEDIIPTLERLGCKILDYGEIPF